VTILPVDVIILMLRFSLAHDSTGNAIGRFDGMYVYVRELLSKVE
jgi:hypothetical protein